MFEAEQTELEYIPRHHKPMVGELTSWNVEWEIYEWQMDQDSIGVHLFLPIAFISRTIKK